MSLTESKFIKWAIGICATLIAMVLFQAFVDIGSVDVTREKVSTNEKNILRIEQTHETDKIEMNQEHREDMKYLQDGQDIMRADIKKILEKL